MKEDLNDLKSIVGENLKGSLTTFENLPSLFTMNKAASNDDLLKCDLYFDEGLAPEYKFFLTNYNGGILFKIEDFAGFKLLSTDELISHNKFQAENFAENWDSQIILFCECIGDAEYLGFKLIEDEVRIIYCIMDTLPEEWKVIEKSFNILINKLIEQRGEKYWLNYF
ncbi:hypothetical protein K6T82_19865 [Flavobacterium sp. 17A]|uniref:Knr4/Smi1-like domain-containing protein n=1 Tax=Flavobacterium potami TaxID=2872310 RepID=A0A9X1HCX4_9FLAO|nr:SMI1/KNR4 family protein [Flavobacterium potami]MBZ4037034.1 hypothetical protein [Flavobacterium potami]